MEKCRANLNVVLESLVSVTFHMSDALAFRAKSMEEKKHFSLSFSYFEMKNQLYKVMKRRRVDG